MASSEPRPNVIPLRKLEPKTSIQQAARDGREAEVRAWLNTVPAGRKRKLLNTKDKYGFTALHYAARFNRFKIMQLLLLDGADPNIKTNEGLTVLHYAARYVPVMQEDMDTPSQGGDIAPSTRNKQMMMLLIDHYKVNVDVTDSYNLTPLHLACTRGNKDAVLVLLNSKKVNVNAKDKQLSTPLHAACRLEDPWFVEQLLVEGAEAMTANDEGSTPLHIACLVGNSDAVKLILKKRFEEREQLLSAKDNEQNTPLHLACETGDVEILHVLFLNQADPEVFKLHGISPFHLAAKEGHTEVAEIMLQYGMSIDVKDDELQTPLHYAARFDQDDMINFLLDKKADIEALDADSYTPLLTAVAYGRKNAMEILLDHQAVVDVIDRDQKSIVFIAAEENYTDILRDLVSGSYHRSCDKLKCTTDSAGNTPLHIAAIKGHLESVRILLRAKDIKISAHNGVGKTPMHLAAEMGHILVVQELAKFKRALLYDEDEDSNTPLHLACINGHYSMAKVLLDAGCEPDQKNAKDWTPMDCAAHGGWDNLVKLLVEAEAELEPEDRGGFTPLQRACKQGHLKVVTLLISKGAQVSHLNHNHMNGLDIAIESGHSNIALAIVESDQWKSALRNTTHLANGRKTTPTRRLIYRMPDVAKVVFNRCLTTNEEADHITREDRNLLVTFNYEFLEDDRDPPPGLLARLFCCSKSSSTDVKSSADSEWGTVFEDEFSDNGDDRVDVTSHSDQDRPPTRNNWGPVGFTKSNHPFRIMVKKNQGELLSHPLVTSLLHYKWVRYGQLAYVTNLLSYLVYLTLLTAFALLIPPPNSEICRNSVINFTNMTCSDYGFSRSRELGVFIIAIIVGLLAIIRLLLEVFEFFTLRIRYFFDWLNYLEVILYSCTIVFIFIFLEPCYCPRNWQWQIGSVVVFLAWIDLISRIRKLPLAGIYVLMFINIFYSFWKMATLSILLILSFAFSFYMLFNDPSLATGRYPFSDVGASIVKTMTMTTGEFEYDTIFRQCGEECPDELPYPIVSYVLWIFFLILMPILLTNLLVGLAVDDVKGIQQAAVLKRLELRVNHTLSVEELMPQALRRFVIITSHTVKPNRKLNIFEKLWYNYLQFSRFDSIEKLNTVLDLPKAQAADARLQSKKLEQKIDSLEERLDYMTELLKTIADKTNVASTEMSIEDLTEI